MSSNISQALIGIATSLQQLAEAMSALTLPDPATQPEPAPQPAAQPAPQPAPQAEPSSMANLFSGGAPAQSNQINPVAPHFPTTQPAAQPAASVTKEDVVNAFQTLHQVKGPDAIVGPAGILVRFGVQRLSDLPENQWADAIAMAQQAMA